MSRKEFLFYLLFATSAGIVAYTLVYASMGNVG